MRKFICLLLAVFLFGSCATVFTGTRDNIRFNTTPEGAIVYKNGVQIGKTPCRVSVKRTVQDTDVELDLDGYEVREFTLDKRFNMVSIVNVINPIGWIIDLATGAIMKYDTRRYEFDLKKENSSANLNSIDEIHIDTAKKHIRVYRSSE